MSAVSPFRAIRKVNGAHSSADVSETRLQQAAKQITTREQLEDILKTARHPNRVRELLEPFLDKDLPCCASAWRGEHTKGCPVQTTVLA